MTSKSRRDGRREMRERPQMHDKLSAQNAPSGAGRALDWAAEMVRRNFENENLAAQTKRA